MNDEWAQFFNSAQGIQFLDILKDYESKCVEDLVGLNSYEAYKWQDGILYGVRQVISMIDELKKGGASS